MARFFCMFKFSRSTLAFLAVGGALVAIVGCQPRGTDLAAIYRQAPPAFASVDYATLRSNVLAPQCISCHADFGTESGLQNYIVPGDSTSSALYRAVANGSMPPGGPPLAGTAVDMFKTYIDGLKTPRRTIMRRLVPPCRSALLPLPQTMPRSERGFLPRAVCNVTGTLARRPASSPM